MVVNTPRRTRNGLARLAGVAYVGSDRRASTGGDERRLGLAASVLGLVAVVGAAGLVWVWRGTAGGRPEDVSRSVAVLAVACVMTFVASVVMLISYRCFGLASHVWMSVDFALVAGLLVIDTVAVVGYDPFAGLASLKAQGLGVCSCGFLLAFRAVIGPTIDARVTPARAAWVAFVSVASLTLLWARAAPTVAAMSGLHIADARAVVRLCMTAAWATAGLTVLFFTWRRQLIVSNQLFVLGCFMMAAWLTIVTERGHHAVPLTAILLITLGAAVATAQGLQQLSRHFAEQARAILDQHVRTATVSETGRIERLCRDERDHDLRSGLLAIETTIEDLSARLATEASLQHLTTAVVIETSRLRRMLSPCESTAQPEVIDLRSALGPLLLLERARDVELHTDLAADVRVGVPPDVIIRIMRILLDNARCHAPGSRVDVTARVSGNRTEITVRDQGAVPSAISPGGRRDDAQDHRPHGGVGLLSATRLIEECGGHLRIDRGAGGGLMFTIDLPALEAPHGEAFVATTLVEGRRRVDQPESNRFRHQDRPVPRTRMA